MFGVFSYTLDSEPEVVAVSTAKNRAKAPVKVAAQPIFLKCLPSRLTLTWSL